jgi:hypothetical protein
MWSFCLTSPSRMNTVPRAMRLGRMQATYFEGIREGEIVKRAGGRKQPRGHLLQRHVRAFKDGGERLGHTAIRRLGGGQRRTGDEAKKIRHKAGFTRDRRFTALLIFSAGTCAAQRSARPSRPAPTWPWPDRCRWRHSSPLLRPDDATRWLWLRRGRDPEWPCPTTR